MLFCFTKIKKGQEVVVLAIPYLVVNWKVSEVHFAVNVPGDLLKQCHIHVRPLIRLAFNTLHLEFLLNGFIFHEKQICKKGRAQCLDHL